MYSKTKDSAPPKVSYFLQGKHCNSNDQRPSSCSTMDPSAGALFEILDRGLCPTDKVSAPKHLEAKGNLGKNTHDTGKRSVSLGECFFMILHHMNSVANIQAKEEKCSHIK